jgi:hypothetical protein
VLEIDGLDGVEAVRPVLAQRRACGDDELADAFGRCAVAVSLWLELPARLAEFAGLPDLQPKREKP